MSYDDLEAVRDLVIAISEQLRRRPDGMDATTYTGLEVASTEFTGLDDLAERLGVQPIPPNADAGISVHRVDLSGSCAEPCYELADLVSAAVTRMGE